MSKNHHGRRLLTRLLLAAGALLLALAGCSDRKSPISPSDLLDPFSARRIPPPIPNSPYNALQLYRWCWNLRGIEQYPSLFPEDYLFACGLADSAGNVYRDVSTREDELAIFRGVMNGTATLPAASRISIDFDRIPLVTPDPRPGKDPRWHRRLSTTMTFRIDLLGNTYRGSGSEAIYFVRGDSALIPQELRERGFAPDSARWWIERWEEVSGPEPATASAAAPDQRAAGAMGVIGAGAAIAGQSSDARAARAVALARSGPFRDLSWCEFRAMYR